MVVIFEDGVFFHVGEGYVMAVRWCNGYGHCPTDTRNTACFPDCFVNDYRCTFLSREDLGPGNGGDEPGYDMAAGVGEDTVRRATEMCSYA